MKKIGNLFIDGRRNPICIACTEPEFRWEITEPEVLQKEYRITVKKNGQTVYDTGFVKSAERCVRAAGLILEGETSYVLSAELKDQYGSLYAQEEPFETGLRDTTMNAWDGAQWIGSDDLPLHTASLSVFKMQASFTFTKKGKCAGFLFSGDDERILDEDRNLFHIQSKEGESFCRVVLDVSGAKEGHCAQVRVHRYGIGPQDSEEPLAVYPVPLEILNKENVLEEHTLYLECEYGQADLFLDGEDEAHRITPHPDGNPFSESQRRLNLNPTGRGGDYICYISAGKVGLYQEGEVSFGSLIIRNFRKPCNVLYEGIPAVNALQDVSHGANVMLAGFFTAKKKAVRAKVYATARGLYELYFNGTKVGEDVLTPGLSQYDCHHYYQAYDVSALLKEGENGIGAVLAEGWFSGSISFAGSNWNYFGDRSSLLVKLVMEYEDGTKDVFVSDPEHWVMSMDGPVRYASIFQGEDRDLRLERVLESFTADSASVRDWQKAEVIAADETTAMVGEDTIGFLGAIEPALDYTRTQLLPQPDESVRVVETLTAVSYTEPRPHLYIYDMGQNMAGMEEIRVQGHAGQKVTLRFAEVLYPDMEEYKGKEGTLMLENIRAALVTDHFILKEGENILRPSFTYHGYRYVEIAGLEEPLPLDHVKGLSISSLTEVTADFRCSDPMVTRLYQNIAWSFRDNYISIPSDCPQRNERMGWSGDLSVFSRTAVYMSMSAPFLHRHLQAMRDTQTDGRFPDIAPIGGGFGGVLWGSAGVTVPWEMYCQYGDTKVLEEMYDSMASYLAYLERNKNEKGLLTCGPLGDWLGPENSKNESAFLWQCYYIYDLAVMQKCAEVLGKSADARKYAESLQEAKDVFRRCYVEEETGMTIYSSEDAAMDMNSPMIPYRKEKAPDRTPAGHYKMDTQTSYAAAIGLGAVDGELRRKMAERLQETCSRKNVDDLGEERDPYTLMTGFIGTAWISQALSECGYDETAWRMLKQTSYPSWLYPVWNGATTIWERLNSFTREKGFGGNNSMNSFNHYSFGAVGAWMLAYAGGVRRGETAGTFRIAPVPDPDGEVTWAETSVQTTAGRYHVKWQRRGKGYSYTLDLPSGTCTPVELEGGGMPMDLAAKCRLTDGLLNIRKEGSRICFLAMPGHYEL